MKLAPALVLALLLVVGYYQACAIPGARRDERRQAQDREHIDSIVAAVAHATQLEAVRDSARRAWLARDARAADSLATLEHRLALYADSSARLTRALSPHLAGLPDSARAAVTAAVRVLALEVETCRGALGVQRDRLVDCQATEAELDDLTRSTLPELHAAVDSALVLARRWQVRAARNERSWGLTVGVGPGMFWTPSDSLVRFGIGATVGISYRIARIPPW